MKHQLRYEQVLHAPMDKVWDFFTDASNLGKLTPKEMNMKVISKMSDNRIFQGMKISYFISPILMIPIFWQTEIITIEDRKQFIDIQRIGTFKLWKHTHSFIEKEEGVRMIDEVEYILPFGRFGNMFNDALVLKNLQDLFKFRAEICDELFNSKN